MRQPDRDPPMVHGQETRASLSSDTEARAVLARRYRRSGWFRSIVANISYGVLYGYAAYFTFRVQAPELSGTTFLRGVALTLLYFGACVAHGWYLHGRLTRKVDAWLRGGETPDEQTRAELLAVPRRAAAWVAAYWVGFGIWLLPWLHYATPYRLNHARVQTILGATALGATMAPALSYLLVERGQRYLQGIVMHGVPTVPTSRMSILSRLLIAYAIGTALPLIQLSFIVVGIPRSSVDLLRGFIWAVSAVAIVTGCALAIFTARGVSDPLGRVRMALGRVKEGDFTSELDVNEIGEVGELQAGFNDMVVGLRERERMRDVFGRHVGPEVARHALEDTFALGGETRQATAMFVDVIGSTGLTQREAPQDVVVLLNAFFDAVIRSVGAEGGLVNKFQGDGALCIFGAPTDQPDHAARALRAARSLRAELASLDGVDAAIGVSSGEVVAGNVGALDRYEYTVIGDTVNEASRLTDEAKLRPSLVLASSTTIGCAAEEAVHWRDAGTFALRGRATPTLAYEPS